MLHLKENNDSRKKIMFQTIYKLCTWMERNLCAAEKKKKSQMTLYNHVLLLKKKKKSDSDNFKAAEYFKLQKKTGRFLKHITDIFNQKPLHAICYLGNSDFLPIND